jgi:signal transduction histidine kinase
MRASVVRLMLWLGPRLAWPGCFGAIATLLAGVALTAASGGSIAPNLPAGGPVYLAYVGLAIGTFIAAACAGASLMAQRPNTPFGWLLLIACAASAKQSLFIGMGQWLARTQPSAAPAEAPAFLIIGAGWLNAIDVVLLVLALLTFPGDTILSRRWWPALWLGAAGATMVGISQTLYPGNFPPFPTYRNPVGLDGAAEALALVRNVGLAISALSVVLASSSLIVRYLRARDEERLQLKAVTLGAVVWTAGLIGVLAAPPSLATAAAFGYTLGICVFLVSLLVSITRYGLYRLEVIVNRAVAYATLATFIGAVYLALVVGVGALVGSRDEPNLFLSLGAMAAVAVAFQPARARAERLANRLVYGRRATPYEAMSGFTERMAGALNASEVLPRTAEAVAKGLGAARVRVRVFLPGPPLELQEATAWWPSPPNTAVPAPGASTTAAPLSAELDRIVPVLHNGEEVGEIAVAMPASNPLSPRDEALLADFAAQAGLALKNAQMTAELRARLLDVSAQAAELRASRQRIVTAQDATRRRLERDIHDGAQQHLVALAVTIRLARQVVEKDTVRAASLLDGLVSQTGEALETLRDLARGIFPPVLRDRGIVPALRAHLLKAMPEAHLEIDARIEAARFSPEVETGVYFCVLEALQNAAKHAPGARVTVRLDLDQPDDPAAAESHLTLAVRDDGPGFNPDLTPSSTGLKSMADRMASLGGTLRIDSAPGLGTEIEGTIPIHALVTA